MPRVNLETLLAAGSHFGHLTRRWNPKMKEFIFMERNGIHIIDLKKSQVRIDEAFDAIKKIVEDGEEVLFVGTKKQAKEIIKGEAKRCGQFFITDRWLGGTLTNFGTIKKSIKHMKNLDKMSSDGTYEKITKKEILHIEREKEKMKKVLDGIEEMKRLPGVIFIVDTKKEQIAVKEARKLNIPIVAIVDTNSDPTIIDYPIPANDDAAKSISIISRVIADAVVEGSQKLKKQQAEQEAIAEAEKAAEIVEKEESKKPAEKTKKEAGTKSSVKETSQKTEKEDKKAKKEETAETESE
ncbi:MAG: 30S ribosomal protein S2 [Calditrichia bacterium]|nr:30S ribosomal protein S2 [Calditrichia bacterium]